MISRKTAKIMSLCFATVCFIMINQSSADAAWKKVNNYWTYTNNNKTVKGWKHINSDWYYFDTSGSSAGKMCTGWKQIGPDWYYMDNKGRMVTGWKKIGPSWYYLNSNGKMARNTTVNGCYVNGSGQWIRNSSASKSSSDSKTSGSTSSGSSESNSSNSARALILKQDGNYIKKAISNGRYIEIEYAGEKTITSLVAGKWDIPDEECYEFNVLDKTDKSCEYDYCNYIIGKKTNKVYCMPNQGGLSAYEVSGNRVVHTYKWKQGNKSISWR